MLSIALGQLEEGLDFDTLTHLQAILFASQQFPDGASQLCTSVPLCKYRFAKVRMHDMLHSPRVLVLIIVRRKLSPDRPSIRPSSRACLGYNTFACLLESCVELRGYETWHDHIALGVIRLLDTGGHTRRKEILPCANEDDRTSDER